MKQVGSFLSKAVPKPEVLNTAKAQVALQQWESIVGPLLASKVQPTKIEKGVLFVTAESSAWAQEIQLLKETVLARVNAAAGEDLLRDLRVARTRRPKQAPLE